MEMHGKWSAALVDWLGYVWLWDHALLTRKLPMFFAMFEWDFDWDSWETISNRDHRSATDKVQQDKTRDAQKFVSMTGARYSVLFQLSYYDAVWFALIDPMHSFLLTSRRTGYMHLLSFCSFFLTGKRRFFGELKLQKYCKTNVLNS